MYLNDKADLAHFPELTTEFGHLVNTKCALLHNLSLAYCMADCLMPPLIACTELSNSWEKLSGENIKMNSQIILFGPKDRSQSL